MGGLKVPPSWKTGFVEPSELFHDKKTPSLDSSQAPQGTVNKEVRAENEDLLCRNEIGKALTKDGSTAIGSNRAATVGVDPLAPGQNQSAAQPRGPLELVGSVGVGAKNDRRDVDRVQQALVPKYLTVGEFIRGEFDEATRKALLEFLGKPVAVCDQRLTPTGDAATRLAAQQHSVQLTSLAFIPPPPSEVPQPPIQSSVGVDGDERHGDNVKAVQARLKELGFPVAVDGWFGPKTEGFIRLFASIVEGKEQHYNATATLEPHGAVTRVLFSPDAPTWVKVQGSGMGWKSVDADNYDYAVDKTLTVIDEVGKAYQRDYLATNTTSSLIKVNDVSRADGKVLWRGGAPEHRSHRNGLDIDIRLPKKPESANFDGGTRTDWLEYDHEAAFAMVKAFAENPEVSRVIMGDMEIRNRAFEQGATWATKLLFDEGHSSHLHVDIIAPQVM